MRTKVPSVLPIASHSYKVLFNPHLLVDERNLGVVYHRLKEIRIESSLADSDKVTTLIHEYLETINRVYGCGLDDANIDRVAEGMGELFKALGIELDWSLIKEAG